MVWSGDDFAELGFTGGQRAAVFVVDVPSGVVGDIELTFGAAVGPGANCAGAHYAISGMDVSNQVPLDSSEDFDGSLSWAVDTYSGGFAIGLAVSFPHAPSDWGGLTETFAVETYFSSTTSFATVEFDATEMGRSFAVAAPASEHDQYNWGAIISWRL